MSFCGSSKVEVKGPKAKAIYEHLHMLLFGILKHENKQTNKQTYLSGTHNTTLPTTLFSFLVVGEILCSKVPIKNVKFQNYVIWKVGMGAKKEKKREGKHYIFVLTTPTFRAT